MHLERQNYKSQSFLILSKINCMKGCTYQESKVIDAANSEPCRENLVTCQKLIRNIKYNSINEF